MNSHNSIGIVACGFVTAATVALATVVASPLPAQDDSGIERALRHRGLKGAKVSALVVDRNSGADIFAHNSDRALIAASNVKVLTALAALDTFGPTHRFITEIYSDRPPDSTGAVGQLTVVGGGDASLTSEQMWRMAADLARRGIRRVKGDIILDAGAFDNQYWHPAWGQTSSRAYHAPVAALSVNYGAFTVEISPGPSGAAAYAALDPDIPYFTLVNQARTSTGSRNKISVHRSTSPNGDRVSVGGSIGDAAKATQIYRSVTQPILYAGHTFAAQLAAVGIEVEGSVHRGHHSPRGIRLLRFEGKPLSEIVSLMMKYSNNNIAETLIKALGYKPGGRGTWDNGLAALRQALLGIGVPANGFHLVDGSGLSRTNRVSSRTLVEATRRASKSFRYGPEFVASLPIAARDGTLKSRAGKTRDRARAKTGLLSGATALTGLAQTASGKEVIFSIIANDYSRGDAEAIAALDAFLSALTAM